MIKASLPEGPAMPKAKESIKLEPDSSKEIPVRSPASSPEYDPWATPKPHADNLIDIPKNISQAHGYDAIDKPATKRAAALFFCCPKACLASI